MRVLAYGVAVIFAVSGLAKLIAPSSGVWLPERFGAVLGLIELSVAIALVSAPMCARVLTCALAFSSALLLGLVILQHAGVPASECGCFGRWLAIRGYPGHYLLHGFILFALSVVLTRHNAESDATPR
jgi:hypothetical protein